MVFLPITQREIREAARSPRTWLLRCCALAIALVPAFFSLLVLSGGNPHGRFVFQTLSLVAGGMCLLSALFTFDSINRERRDGTLELLFLTPLHPYDVILGKFTARWLHAAYCLAAVLPVAAVPLILGGVTIGEFWRTALALANGLFFSLATGLVISVFHQGYLHGLTSLIITLGFLITFVPGVLTSTGWVQPESRVGAVLGASPMVAYLLSGERFTLHGSAFYTSLITSHAFAWGLLAIASKALALRWRETRAPQAVKSESTSPYAPGGTYKSIRNRAALEVNPVSYLIADEPRLRTVALAILSVAGAFVFLVNLGEPEVGFVLVTASKFCGFLLKASIAFLACKFFIEGRRDGVFEMLLSTPFAERDIVRGNLIAIVRVFQWPVVLYLSLHLIPTLIWLFRLGIGIDSSKESLAAGELLTPVVWLTAGFLADAAALIMLGMWLSVSMKRPAHAPLVAIFIVLILPSMTLCGVIPVMGICGLDFFLDLLLILWAGNRLNLHLRAALTRPV